MTLIASLLALAMQSEGYVVASTASTSVLAKICKDADSDLAADFCSGYVLATFDLLSRKRLICPTDGVTTEQTMAVARRYLASHPELWDRSPSWVIERALVEAYRCRRNSN